MLNLHEWKHSELAEAAYDRGYENAYEMTEHELRDTLYDLLNDDKGNGYDGYGIGMV
jgi:hypothetical protein